MIFGNDKATWESQHAIFTASEIHQQPATWRETIAQIKSEKEAIRRFIANVTDKDDYDIILTGAGTSEYVGNALYSYLNKINGFKVKSYATTDIVASPENYLSQTRPTLLVSFGRSGNSPESVGAVNVADEVCGEHVYHLFITCNAQGALSKAAAGRHNAYAINLTPKTHDQSFAMTSSFTNMMLAALLCFDLDHIDAIAAEFEDVITAAETMLTEGWKLPAAIVAGYDFQRIVYLGANVLKGIAQESQLKMLELTAGKVCTCFDSPMGFRHGPKSIIDDHTLTVIYVSDDAYTRQYEVDLIKEISGQRKGNKILAVMNKQDDAIASLVDYTIAFHMAKSHDNMLLGFAYVTVAQMIALFKSLAYGITPDNPCPSGEVNRVVKGVILHPYTKR